MAETGLAEIRIYDLAGRLMSDLSINASRGRNVISWDGRTTDGVSLPSGIYLVILRANGVEDREKITLVK